ncbi:MAG: NYN domain-containing protein [Hyphomicrobiaceae bacterium]|nr:MAG: NYN domain-containing protein [Hyphomicrobiaceae bacterium]
MKREAGGPCLSAVFVDYDNIYLSLKRKSEEAAKRFAKDAASWIREIETGRLITATNSPFGDVKRRIVMNRCYGNPVPRRNPHDNSTDMNSFPFVRHHFLRAGFEVVDCPPLTAQLKNSSDIRMVMDVRDYLTHETYFDEFIILSGDADFTPVLHRLRAHARRTVIFANDFTAAPYTAISDGEVRESDLIALILGGQLPADAAGNATPGILTPSARADEARREIMAEVVAAVRASATPVPLEALADRALRALGHEKTIATGWAGAGSFRELLRQSLPEEIRLTEEAPYLAFDPKRHLRDQGRPMALEARDPAHEIAPPPLSTIPIPAGGPLPSFGAPTAPPLRSALPAASARPAEGLPGASRAAPPPPPATLGASQPPRIEGSAAIQQSISRIHEACQAPPMAPHEYRVLFEVMAKEINENDLIGAQTLANITQRAQERGLDVRRDDVRFVLEVVSEADPWFEQGASANLFAGRFRNFVVARCRGQGLNLSADELDLIDAWFAGGTLPQQTSARAGGSAASAPAAPPMQPMPQPAPPSASSGSTAARWWSHDKGGSQDDEARASGSTQSEGDDFPRIVSGRRRG